MIEIIAVKKRKPEQIDTDNIVYVEDSKKLDSMAKKYNWAIENFVLKSDDDVICFRHEDTEIRSGRDVVESQVRQAVAAGCGVCGVIGTIALENSCVWWTPNRQVNGSGFIIQGGEKTKVDEGGHPVLDENGKPLVEKIEYPMKDHPGVHYYLATVDGCCMWLNRKMIESGVRFDETLEGYHFYDADICCQALENGFKVGTVAVTVKHDSSGVVSEKFEKYKEKFFKKWNEKIDTWPITRLTEFKKQKS